MGCEQTHIIIYILCIYIYGLPSISWSSEFSPPGSVYASDPGAKAPPEQLMIRFVRPFNDELIVYIYYN